MTKKEKIFRVIDRYVSIIKKEDMSLMYGKGFKFKVHTYSSSVREKILLFECIVTLGENIDHSMMDPYIADFYVREAAATIFPDLKIRTLIRWDS